MKICFFIPWITKSRGGTENVGQMMANAMAARGHKVDIVTFDDARAPSRWPMAEEIALHHAEEAEGPQQDSRLLVLLATIDPDLIVGLHMNRTFLRYVRVAGKLKRPIVLSEHIDPHFPQRIGSFSSHERMVAFQGASRIHLLAEAFRDTLPLHLRSRAKVIPNTVPPAARVADPAGRAGSTKILLTVARLVPRKNLSRLLEEFSMIASEHPDWILRVLGDGSQRVALEDRAAELGIASQVEFCGEVATVYEHLSRAHCFVLPSLFEGFPMSSLEALAHGLPVVGYKLCNGLNVQVQDGINGLLVGHPSVAGELAQALSQLMSDSDMRARMGTASLKRYEAYYANAVIFNSWEAMFQEAAQETPIQQVPLETRLAAELERYILGDVT